MYKTMGGGSWSGILPPSSDHSEETLPHMSFEPSSFQPEGNHHSNKKAEEIEEAVQVITGQFSLAWQSLKHVCFNLIISHSFG